MKTSARFLSGTVLGITWESPQVDLHLDSFNQRCTLRFTSRRRHSLLYPRSKTNLTRNFESIATQGFSFRIHVFHEERISKLAVAQVVVVCSFQISRHLLCSFNMLMSGILQQLRISGCNSRHIPTYYQYHTAASQL